MSFVLKTVLPASLARGCTDMCVRLTAPPSSPDPAVPPADLRSGYFDDLVVNLTLPGSRCDVFCGRRGSSAHVSGDPAPWGNYAYTSRLLSDHDRLAAVRAYLSLLRRSPHLVSRIRAELPGLTLGCYCAPELCHCHLLAEIANSPPDRLAALALPLSRASSPAPSPPTAAPVPPTR